MEIRRYAMRIIEATSLSKKLDPPKGPLTDRFPGAAVRLLSPGRPPELAMTRVSEAKVPPIEGMLDPEQRRRILHAMANHELQAVELFAWALLSFPEAPRGFREGVLRILREEQMHCRLYCRRLQSLNVSLGDYPVTGYFWNKVAEITTPARFVCAMSLTFENANLDHTIEYARAARKAGDEDTARLLDRVHGDEIGHVRFGWEWLRRLEAKPGKDRWSAARSYVENTVWPLRPSLARGRHFHPEGRRRAGLDDEFIRMLAEAGPPSRERPFLHDRMSEAP